MPALTGNFLLPSATHVFLAEITAWKRFQNWVNHSGNAWKVSTPLPIYSVLAANYAALTEVADSATVVTTPSSWHHDGTTLFIRHPGGGNPHQSTPVRAEVRYYLSTHAKNFNGEFYDPRLIDLPRASFRVESNFGASLQIGSGTASFANDDGFFNTTDGVDWSAGEVVFKMGADLPASAMVYGSYASFGSWKIESWTRSSERFTVRLIEKKASLETNLPLTTYSRSWFDGIHKNDEGKPVPIAYGRVFGVKPALVNVGTKTYQVASHSIRSIDEIRVKQTSETGTNDLWLPVNYESVDLELAQFTLGSSWEQEVELSVDFTGKIGDDGLALVNPSDVVRDLCELAGATRFNEDSFTRSWNFYDVGARDRGERHSLLQPSIFIGSRRRASDVLKEICDTVGAALFYDADGDLHFRAFQPDADTLLETWDETHVLGNSLQIHVDSEPVKNEIVVRYARRDMDDWSQSVSDLITFGSFIANAGAFAVEEKLVPLSEPRDAAYFARRFLNINSTPFVTVQFQAPFIAFAKRPCERVRLKLPSLGIDGTLEITEITPSTSDMTARIVGTLNKGFLDSIGFWASGSQAAWGASATAEEKVTAKTQSGYWTDDNSFAVTTDEHSFQSSRWL